MLSFLYGLTLTSIQNYWKNHSFTRWNLASKVKSLHFNVLSRMVIVFLPRSMLSGKPELIHWGSPNNEENHKLMKQGAQRWVVPDLVKSAVHVLVRMNNLPHGTPTCQPLPQVTHLTYGRDDCIPWSHGDMERGWEKGHGSSEITSGTRNPREALCLLTRTGS